jgi:hypothetical protein
VLGAGRVGIYGGYWIVSRCAENQSAKWFWQTTAWSGGNIFPGNHLYQHDYNIFIAGTNVDATRALQDNYGQASKFRGGKPAPQPKPVVAYPEGMDAGVARKAFGSFKASNGVTVSYSEGDELSALWLASGSYGRITDVLIAKDSPTITRIYWYFSDGHCFWRPNDAAPIRLMGGA